MNNSTFQDVFNLLQGTLPDVWDKLIFYAGYMKGSYSMKFYIKQINKEYVDCFHLSSITQIQLVRLFMNIDNILSPERDKETETNKWTVMTMQVDSKGNMKTDFDYEDISENTVLHERKWNEKYLK